MTDKQWYFDPGSPASVPPQLLPVLEEKGIPQDHIKLCFASDLNRDMIRCENYVLCTDSDIMVISGSMTLTKKARTIPVVTTNPAYHHSEGRRWP